MTEARLVTIGLSHFCEKARWALSWTRTPFVEEAHAPGMHLLAVRRAGGRSTPVLVMKGSALRDSTDILVALDAAATPDRRLFPSEASLRREALQLEETFDDKLGPAVRRAMYHLILPHRAPSLRFMTANVPFAEKATLYALFPLVRAVIRRSLKIDDDGAARSRRVMDRIFDEVSERLRDGRRYLVGDAFTAADLTFAALAAPAVLPRTYGWPMPDVDETPDDVAALVRRLRATPAGAFALRMYDEHRSCA